MKRILAIVFITLCLNASGQSNFFVDGFHGGTYGHYPMAWYTQFMVDQLKLYPQWCIGLEIEPATWDTAMVQTPQAYHDFKSMVCSSQVEYTNPTYAQPYLYNIIGESIIRQFQYGIRKLKNHFPAITFSTYASEEPCFTSQLPQILSLFGFKYLSLKNPNTCWGGYADAFGGQLVRLTGPDGTTMYAVPRYACETLQKNSVWQTIAWNNSNEFLIACRKAGIDKPVGMCYQDAGWKKGPWLHDHQKDTQYIRWTDYIEHYTNKRNATNRSFSQEDIRPALMWGTQVLQRIAREVRHAENHIVQTEKLASMRYLEDHVRPDQKSIDEAWRNLLLSQHHDSWIVPYNRFKIKGSWAKAIDFWTGTCDSIAQSIARQATNVDGDTSFITLYNTTAHVRKEVVAVAPKRLTDCQIPAFGHISMPMPEAQPVMRKQIVADTCALENDVCRLAFDLKHGGVVTSLMDKRNHEEMVDPTRTDYHFGELRGYFPERGRFCSSTESHVKATLTTVGSLTSQLQLEGTIAGTRFIKTLTLKKGSQLVDCKLYLDWKENIRIGEDVKSQENASRTGFYDTRYMLSLFFPTLMKNARLSKDAPFDVCESKQDDTFFNNWNNIKHNILLHWADICDGRKALTLLTDHTTSYSYGGNYPLALTVQYSGPGLWWRNYPITGPSEIRYAIAVHSDSWDKAGVQQLSENWQEPVIVTRGRAKGGIKSLLSSPFRLSAMTVNADGTVNVRLFNADNDETPQTITFNVNVKKAILTNLNGKPLKILKLHHQQITLRIPRFGIRNIIIEP